MVLTQPWWDRRLNVLCSFRKNERCFFLSFFFQPSSKLSNQSQIVFSSSIDSPRELSWLCLWKWKDFPLYSSLHLSLKLSLPPPSPHFIDWLFINPVCSLSIYTHACTHRLSLSPSLWLLLFTFFQHSINFFSCSLVSSMVSLHLPLPLSLHSTLV